MPINEVTKVHNALENLQRVRAVNSLLQGICRRIEGEELTETEAEGLYVVLEWQNQQMLNSEAVIKTVLAGAAIKAA